MASSQSSFVVQLPTSWDNSGSQTELKLVPISDRTSKEYITISNLFGDTMDDRANICSIQRVQNPQLMTDFSRKREQMIQKNMDGNVLEMQLFHGTQLGNIDAICRQNFDWKLNGTNVGAHYGRGSYFARDARDADYYTAQDSDGFHYVFVAQVLVGDYTTGKSSLVLPPPKYGNPNLDLYDSCVDNIDHPKLHVVFDKTQTYPEYLIKYKRKKGHEESQCTTQ